MREKAFVEAIEVIEQIELNGFEAYFVGGCVRDSLLNKDITDIDIATSASPTEVQTIFEKTIPVGIEHGTVVVIHHGISYEVTTFRQDGDYSDQRHPDQVSFVKKIDEDLKRRDFTINSLALNSNGELIDLFGGRQDLENKLIRTVGNPNDRFQEDPLRIVRALRFSSQLGFDIDPQTLLSMTELNREIASVAVERLTNEFTRFFQGEYVDKGIQYLTSTNIDQYLPVFKNHRHLLRQLPTSLSPFISFAEVITLFHHLENGIPIQEWIRSWKCSNKIRREAMNLYEALNNFTENGLNDLLIYRLDQKYFKAFIHLISTLFEQAFTLEHLQQWKNQLPIQKREDLAINGYDIMKIMDGVKRGPWMKDLLASIEQLVVQKKLDNTKSAIKEWILCHPPEIN